MVSIGHIIRSLIVEKGRTQADLAFNCGIPPYKISNLENGLCENVGIFTLIRISEVLDVHLNVFFMGEKENPAVS